MNNEQRIKLVEAAQKYISEPKGPDEDDHRILIYGILQQELFRLGVRDECEECKGESGGVPGNENVVDGRVLCDYCSSKTW
jgi:hypothetical protein